MNLNLNDMEEIFAEYINHINDEIKAQIAKAFFLKFNADVFILARLSE